MCSEQSGAAAAVLLPGPWWQPLSYASDYPIKPGCRVCVPVGKSRKVGVIWPGAADAGVTLKPVDRIVDKCPVIPADIMHLCSWGAKWFSCAAGSVLEMLVPRWVLSDKELGDSITEGPRGIFRTDYAYIPCDMSRMEEYAKIAAQSAGSVIAAFPDRSQAKLFCKFLPDAVLWPESGRAQRLVWESARSGSVRVIAGCCNVLSLPVPSLGTIIMDEDESSAWRPQRHPRIHMRALSAERCRIRGACLVLGGRFPSSKAFVKMPFMEMGNSSPSERLIYVDIKAIKDEVRISYPLRRETGTALQNGKSALWILDRRGFAGLLICSECGHIWRCHTCDRPLVWHKSTDRLRCAACGFDSAAPDVCGNCSGSWIEASRPGLEALYERACALYGTAAVLFQKGMPLEKIKKGSLLLGTRSVLELCDTKEVGMVGWIEADGESMKQEHDAEKNAFGLIWESCWRGIAADTRRVVLQSYVPQMGWRGCLARGYNSFWQRELKQRKALSLPPFGVIGRICAPEGLLDVYAHNLDNYGASWIREGDCISVRSDSHAELCKVLSKCARPRRMIDQYPKVEIVGD